MGTSVDLDSDDGGSILLRNIVSTTKPSRCCNTENQRTVIKNILGKMTARWFSSFVG